MRNVFPFILCGMFAAVPTITGCGEKTVSKETTTVRDGDGDVKRQTERKVTKQSDGTMRETTTEKSMNR